MADERCAGSVVFPCTAWEELVDHTVICDQMEKGCGYPCLGEVVGDLAALQGVT